MTLVVDKEGLLILSDMVQANLGYYYDPKNPEKLDTFVSGIREMIGVDNSDLNKDPECKDNSGTILDECPEYLAIAMYGIAEFQKHAIERWHHWIEVGEFPALREVLGTVNFHTDYHKFINEHKVRENFTLMIAALFLFQESIGENVGQLPR